jgi:hypothetical protein
VEAVNTSQEGKDVIPGVVVERQPAIKADGRFTGVNDATDEMSRV